VLSEHLSGNQDITVASEDPEIKEEILLERGNTQCDVPSES
jgi:hypothetical protein